MSPRSPSAPELQVFADDGRSRRFARPFHIGRQEDCDFQIDDPGVSRKHVVVAPADGDWWVRDLRSRNGLFVDGEQVDDVRVGEGVTIRLGEDGPTLTLEPVSRLSASPSSSPRLRDATDPADSPVRSNERAPAASADLESLQDRYFRGTGSDEEPVGERTMMIREAYQQLRQQQRRRQILLLSAAAAVAFLGGGYGLYSYLQRRDQTGVAQDLFYAMKALDVDIANVERLVATSANSDARTGLAATVARRAEIEQSYESFRLRTRLDQRLSEPDRLILRVTRLFGECDLLAPSGYLAEVRRYIKMWQGSDRYRTAIEVAARQGYTQRIVSELQAQHLPPHFFYLAMQESNFDPFVSGRITRMGIAKGMWQFIPETAQKYGLKIGPLAGVARPDPADDRHRWDLATVAAARYIKDIYATDAQASGLLVMASYNWGEDKVVTLLRTMPANPRQRNFWQLLSRYRDQIPDETYDYVFYIVSAAVIGENPRLFGFDFDNPLGSIGRA